MKNFIFLSWFLKKQKNLHLENQSESHREYEMSFFTDVHQLSIKKSRYCHSSWNDWYLPLTNDWCFWHKLKFKMKIQVQQEIFEKCTYGKTNDPSINPVRHKTPFRRIFNSNSDFFRRWTRFFNSVDSKLFAKKCSIFDFC